MAQSDISCQRVLLGFRDAPIANNVCSWDVSKIGGVPDVPPQVSLDVPSCPLCSRPLCHVTQVYCPLEGSAFHRVVHVFACVGKQCWGKQESWVALRSQSLQEHEPPHVKETLSQQQENVAATDWCEDADDWGADDDSVGQTSAVVSLPSSCPAEPVNTDCTLSLRDLSLSDRSPNEHSLDSAFCSYYISVADEEECGSSSDLDHAQRLLREYEKREGLLLEDQGSNCTGKGEMEKYEKHNLRSHDIVFYKFMKKISHCSQQILRYSWSGMPLYMSPIEVGFHPPPCIQCGGCRVFEFQLMPALVSMLRSTETDLLLEFGTVLVFTCARSCWAAGDRKSVQEFCFVQEDPDQQYFK
ncbi:programmed cell death protein 2-like [Spea bombifrons]|uniref:programmed cell death protein 2-like n=1 Tax=Spea bombifrons TaxID=233779 RepID=UPI0023490E4B|nr:programmed cell death protein 2-like [Spea bombifrons]XP_053305191.1 programmed cell death protein 2-like [Spea bombifrons]